MANGDFSKSPPLELFEAKSPNILDAINYHYKCLFVIIGYLLMLKTKKNVKKPEITYDAAVLRLTSKLKKSVSIGRRNLEEKITINEIIELYVPIYEARLIGPKKNVRLIRIDSIRKKVL